uniref:Secreted protein n=1 Tax=Panagrolaimus davidi TaxID=227884 RepID=A0A914R5A3_9BILA
MTTFIVLIVTVSCFALTIATNVQQPESNIHTSDVAANPKVLLPRIGAGVIAPPPKKPLPGNLGINGNKWGASLLPKLEGVLGGLINGIHLSPAIKEQHGNGIEVPQNSQKTNSVAD